MEQEVMQRRNALFALLYRKTVSLYAAFVPRPVRWATEMLVLLMALLVLFLWGFIHFTYVINPGDCLEPVTERPFPYDVILQVEVYANNSYLWSQREVALAELYESISRDDSFSGLAVDSPEPKLDLQDGFKDAYEQAKKTRRSWREKLFGLLYIAFDTDEDESADHLSDGGGGNEQLDEGIDVDVPESTSDGLSQTEVENNVTNQDEETGTRYKMPQEYLSSFSGTHTLYELFDFYTLRLLSFDYTILEFSQEPGYLSLTQSARTRLNISVVKIYIDPDNSSCFGGPFGQFITSYFLGYEMMIIASFKNLLPPEQGSGYVKNLLTGTQYYYRVQWMGKWRYGAGLLPALFFTLVASVLLRQVHYHVFKFLTHFHHLLNQGIPMPVQTGAQVPFLIVTYASIGLIIVMSEALSDDSVFSLLMVATVWEVDQFYAVYCRNRASKMFFPWFFYLYHFMPYAYYIRFNGQFWFIPFCFHWLLLQHAMLFFLHHYELPALRQQRIVVPLVRHHPILHQVQPQLQPQPQQLQPQPQLHGLDRDRLREEIRAPELRRRRPNAAQNTVLGTRGAPRTELGARRDTAAVGFSDDENLFRTSAAGEAGRPSNEEHTLVSTEESSSNVESTIVITNTTRLPLLLGREQLQNQPPRPDSYHGILRREEASHSPSLHSSPVSFPSVSTDLHPTPERLRERRAVYYNKQEQGTESIHD